LTTTLQYRKRCEVQHEDAEEFWRGSVRYTAELYIDFLIFSLIHRASVVSSEFKQKIT
jgi:hypothetical protein